MTKKIDYSIMFFLLFFIILCFTISYSNDIAEIMVVYYLSTNQVILALGLCFVFTLYSLIKYPSFDKMIFLLFSSMILGLLPYIYSENVNNYWGNYLPLLISLISYFICVQSNIEYMDKIYKIICFVSFVISIQVIITDFEYFPSVSINNFKDVSVKGFMYIPIGSSNLIAAFLLPMIVFIWSFRKNKISFIIIVISVFALFLCRSKNALALLLLLVFVVLIKKIFLFIINDKSINKKIKYIIFGIITILSLGGFFFLSNMVGLIVTSLQFSVYESPYSSDIIRFLDQISSGRIAVFHNELIRTSNHLFFGNGFGYEIGQLKSHNWIIELLVQKGLIGLLIYLSLLFIIIKKAMIFYKDPFISASIKLLLVFFLQGLFEVTIFTLGVDFFIWSMSGFLVARTRYLKKHNVNLNEGD